MAQEVIQKRLYRIGAWRLRCGPDGKTLEGDTLAAATVQTFPSHIKVPERTGGQKNKYRCYRSGDGGAGWTVTVTLEGKKFVSYFADAKFGSAALSLAAAERAAQRDSGVHKELLSLKRRLRIRANNTSGMPGVTRCRGSQGRGPHWAAYWRDAKSGKRIYKRFLVAEFGEETSRYRAMKAREAAVEADRSRLARCLIPAFDGAGLT